VMCFLPWGVQEPFLAFDGPMEIRRGGVSEGVQHVSLLTTCLETYADAAAAARGTGCRGRIERADVRSVSATDRSIILDMAFDERVEFLCQPGGDFDSWVAAFGLAFPFREDGARSPHVSFREVRPLPSETSQFSAPSQPPQLSAKLQLPEPPVEPEKPTRKAEQERAARQKSTTSIVRHVDGRTWWDPPSNILAEAASAMIAQWVASLPTLPVKTGLLGVQDQAGRTVPRFCALFGDRLEEWEQPSDAAHGKRPKRRIAAKDILGFETLGGGLVLNVGKRLLGVRVRTTDDLHLWSQALLEVLAPGDKPDTWGMVQTETFATTAAPQKADAESSKEAPKAQPKRTDRSIMDADAPKHYEKLTESRRRSIFTARALSPVMTPRGAGKLFKINTHRDGREAEEHVCGMSARILRYSDEPGTDFVHTGVATKVNTSRDGIWQEPRKISMADKITGERALSPRSKSANIPRKITEFDQVSARRPRRSVGGRVAAPVPTVQEDGPRPEGAQPPPGPTRRRPRTSCRALKANEDPQGRSEVLSSRRAKAAMEPSAKVTEMVIHGWPTAVH